MVSGSKPGQVVRFALENIRQDFSGNVHKQGEKTNIFRKIKSKDVKHFSIDLCQEKIIKILLDLEPTL